jgi:hypothetical protein
MTPKILPLDWDLTDPPPERQPPPGGWQPITCTFESHTWHLDVESGHATITCADPCDPDVLDLSSGNLPACLCDWQPEDFGTAEPIPVRLTYVDDSTPSTPMGPAEYGYYIEVRPPVATAQEQTP